MPPRFHSPALLHSTPLIPIKRPRCIKTSTQRIHNLRFTNSIASFTSEARVPQSRPQVIREVPELRQYRQTIRDAFHPSQDSSGTITRTPRTVGFVATMGALHEGHLSLVRAAARENDEVFVSIFVNPTQFGANEDLGSYPRTFDTDMQKLEGLNKEFEMNRERAYKGRLTTVFAPTASTMYPTDPPSSDPSGRGTFVNTYPLATLLEGGSRPTFFRGVATVCAKYFNIVQAERVYFGQKDAQQAAVIRKLVKDLHFDTEVKIVPTEREQDGLAMSSRNVYLGERRRRAALLLPRMLRRIEERYKHEERRTSDELLQWSNMVKIGETGDEKLLGKKSRWEIDYISLSDPDTMEEIEVVDSGQGAVVSAAVKMLPIDDPQPEELARDDEALSRAVRLIDNVILPPIFNT